MEPRERPRRPPGEPASRQSAAARHHEADAEPRPPTNVGWPSVTFEQLAWIPPIDVPRRWQATYTGSYEAAIVPSIAVAVPQIPAPVAAELAEASATIGRFDGEMGSEIAPFGAVLLRTESAASSRIENLTASAKSIALAELGDTSKRNASEIVASTRAMNAAIALADRLDERAILEMHAALVESHHPSIAGRWRDRQVWIGRSSFGPHTASFVPPHHRWVPAALADLVEFMRRDDIAVLAHAALAHAQFETIHPFVDGNGRTGRALVHSLLRAKRLTSQVTVPVSAGLLVQVDSYFDALGSYRDGDIVPIVERFAEATFLAVAKGRQLVEDLRAIRDDWTQRLTARRQAVVWRALDVVLRQPIVDASYLQRALGVSFPGATTAIANLAAIGALQQITDGRRNRIWAAPAILRALDTFAERAGRRTVAGSG